MQFTSTIIVALLAVSTSPITTAQKFSNLRGGDGGHGVGVGLDTTAHKATLVPVDKVPLARKLEEEKGLDAQFDGCGGVHSHVKDLDYKCPDGEIRCASVFPPYLTYCHDPKVCPNSDPHIKDRDSECPTGEIMCNDDIDIHYCHKY